MTMKHSVVYEQKVNELLDAADRADDMETATYLVAKAQVWATMAVAAETWSSE